MTAFCTRQVPRRVSLRLRVWWLSAYATAALYFLLVGGGVLAGALAAATPTKDSPVFGIIAAVCTSLLAAVNPRRLYRQYIRPWRLLDNAVGRYENCLNVSLDDVFTTMALGEQLIDHFEVDDDARGKPHPPPIPHN
jgi:hypothetical protein